MALKTKSIKPMTNFKITQETINALLNFQQGLNYIDDHNLLTDRHSDFCSDLFGEVLVSIGKDYEW